MSVQVSDKMPVRTVTFYTGEPGLTPGSGPDSNQDPDRHQ